jgi:type 1 glutamine amidotransferase
LKQWGQESGLFDTVESQESGKVITPENLKNFDAILFYTTLDLPLDTEQKAALLDFVKNGKAFIGVHSATDTFHNWSGYYEMINGTFDGHPWGAGTTVTVTNHEPTHPCVKMFDSEFPFKDEIYQYKNYNPNSVRVLLSLDMAKTKPQMPYHVPICWVREYGSGRLFYTNLGHNDGTWANPKFREAHSRRFPLGDEDGRRPGAAESRRAGVRECQRLRRLHGCGCWKES